VASFISVLGCGTSAVGPLLHAFPLAWSCRLAAHHELFAFLLWCISTVWTTTSDVGPRTRLRRGIIDGSP
jgi:hypothetical protein